MKLGDQPAAVWSWGAPLAIAIAAVAAMVQWVAR